MAGIDWEPAGHPMQVWVGLEVELNEQWLQLVADELATHAPGRVTHISIVRDESYGGTVTAMVVPARESPELSIKSALRDAFSLLPDEPDD